MKTLTADRLRTRLGSNIREGIKDVVSDPVDGRRKFVYDDMPDVKGASFYGYPFVLVADYSATQDDEAADSRTVHIEGAVQLEIFGQRNEGPTAKENFDILCDEVDAAFQRGFNDQTKDVRMANVMTTSDQRFPARDEADEAVVVREIGYEFDSVIVY
jgi:hypothetical protein